jgi:hypothetical protein
MGGEMETALGNDDFNERMKECIRFLKVSKLEANESSKQSQEAVDKMEDALENIGELKDSIIRNAKNN